MKKKQLNRIEMKLNLLLKQNGLQEQAQKIDETVGGNLPPDDPDGD